MTMNLCFSTSLFPSLTSHHPPCLSTPQTGVFCFFFHTQADGFKQQVSPHGSLTRRSWTLHACLNCRVGRVEKKKRKKKKERGPNRFVHNSDSSLNARSGSKQMERSARGKCWGSEGRRVGEGKREGQIPGEQISHRSRRICVIRKGNNGFR